MIERLKHKFIPQETNLLKIAQKGKQPNNFASIHVKMEEIIHG